MGCNFSRHESEDGTVRVDIDCTPINVVGIDRAIKAEYEVWHPSLEDSPTEFYASNGPGLFYTYPTMDALLNSIFNRNND